MTAPADKPAGWSPVDDFVPRKITPEEAKLLFANLDISDFHPNVISPLDHDEAVRLLCQLAGMELTTCKPVTRKNLRAAGRLLLENVTLAEAQAVVESMDAKSLAWYKANGSPHGAATKIIDEVSRMVAKQNKQDEWKSYLGWEQ